MKKYLLMAVATLCLALAAPASISQAQILTEQAESGLLLRIFDAASVQFAKVGLSYSVSGLSTGYKAGTVTVDEVVGGNGFAVTADGNPVIITLGDLL